MILITILVIALHVFAIYHAMQNMKKTRNGASRLVFAFFPPFIGANDLLLYDSKFWQGEAYIYGWEAKVFLK